VPKILQLLTGMIFLVTTVRTFFDVGRTRQLPGGKRMAPTTLHTYAYWRQRVRSNLVVVPENAFHTCRITCAGHPVFGARTCWRIWRRRTAQPICASRARSWLSASCDEKIGLYFGSRGWAFAHLEPVGPSATELAQGPSLAGYPCSPTVDERGLPAWIIVEGKRAQRRAKQGDAWYSARLADGAHAQVLRIPKGEKPPEVKGLWAATIVSGSPPSPS
jgi:hypothetical protein